jgi:glutamate formiminotransferase/formiminotetrahydrofolate cyclodeaminase
MSTSSDSPAKLVYQPVLGFVEQIAAKSAAPGGGSAAALSGAVGSALLTMVINFTIDKKDYAAVAPRFAELRTRTESLRTQLTKNVDDDTDAFNRYRLANKLPERDEKERLQKVEELAAATADTIRVPHSTMTLCLEGLEIAPEVARHGNVNTVSDAGTGAEMLLAGLEGAALNVLINLTGMSESETLEWNRKVKQARERGRKLLEESRAILREKLHG